MKGFIFALVFALATVPTCWAGISQFAGGVSTSVPMASYYNTIQRSTGAQGKVWYELPQLGEDLVFQGALGYTSYAVRNSSNLSVNMTTALVGAQTQGGGIWGITPTFALLLGFAYDTLGYGSVSTVTNGNTATNFATQIVPGVDVPLYKHLGLLAEFPFTTVFVKSTLNIWSTQFSLRWRL